MTIAAGLHCDDGLLLCADTEQTDYVGKYQREKVFNFRDHVMLTGAGTSDVIKMAFDKLCDKYTENPPPSPLDARQLVEDVTLDVYDKHILPFYAVDDRNKPSMELICALRCADGSPAMVKTSDTAVVLGGFFESVGVGRYLFEYWAQLLYHPTLTINLASYIAGFILSQVKQNVLACGGHSLVLAMHNDASKKPRAHLLPESALFGGFPQSIAPVLIQCRDVKNVRDADFEKSIADFLRGIRMIREQERIALNASLVMERGVLPDAPLGIEKTTDDLLSKENKPNSTKDTE